MTTEQLDQGRTPPPPERRPPTENRRDRVAGGKIWDSRLVRAATGESFPKLDPRQMVKNPVMFVVEIGSVLTTLVLIQGSWGWPRSTCCS